MTYNNRIQLTVKSVTFFAKQKSAPLFTSADAGVSMPRLVFRKQVHRLKFYNKCRGDDVLRRNYKQINQLERDQIAIQRSKGHSFSAISKVLGRSGSTLSREYKRNLNYEGNYLPSEAGYKSRRRKKRRQK